MSLIQWLRKLKASKSQAKKTNSWRTVPSWRRSMLGLERLEDRLAPTVSIAPTNNGGQGYTALGFSQSGGYAPPDTSGAAGPTGYVETVNQTVALYASKSAGTPAITSSLSNFWFTTGGLAHADGGSRLSDPIVAYDDQIGRFVVGDQDVNFGTHVSTFDIAVSKTSIPSTLSAADWTFYQINTTETAFDADYPGNFGYNHDAFVFTLNMFGNSVHSLVVSVNSADLASSVSQSSLRVYKNDVADISLRPTTMHDSVAGDPMWLVAEHGGNASIDVIKDTNVLSNASSFAFTNLAVAAYSRTANPLNPNGSVITNNLDSRILKAAEWNNVLVATHSVSVSSTEDDAQWYSVDVSTGTPALIDQGRVSAGNNTYITYPGIDVNASGQIAMSYMKSGTDTSTDFLSMYVTGRKPGDAAGTMQPSVLVPAGAGQASYSDFTPGGRAGDLSGINVDPIDGSFWAANEFANRESGANWGTAVANFTVSAPLVYNASSNPGVTSYTLRLDNGNLEIVDSSNTSRVLALQPYSGSPGVRITGQSADTLTVDFGFGGYFSVPGGIAFAAGGSGTLRVAGGSFANITDNATGPGAGSLVFTPATSNASAITYSGLAPIVVGSVAGDVTINLPAGVTDAVLQAGTSGMETVSSTSNAFESMTFADPTGTLFVNAAAGAADVLNVKALNASFDGNLNINLKANTSGTSEVDFTGANSLTGAKDITAAAGTITDAGALSTGGNISLTADNSLALAAGLTATGTVTLTDNNGSIAQTAGTITAGGLSLSASTGIGTSSAALQTQVGTLAATTATGGVFVTNTGDLTVGTVGMISGVTDTGATGNINVTSTGGLTVGQNVTTGAGNITLRGAGSATSLIGVEINGAMVTAGTGGNVSVTGSGAVSATALAAGVYIHGGATVKGGGTTTVVGMGGTGAGDSNYGVYVFGSGSQIVSGNGTVTVTGTGGGSVGSRDDIGVKVNNGGSIKAGGSGGVIVHGYGGGGSGDVSYGVYVFQNGAQIASNGGSVAVTGTGGTGSGNNDIGVFVDQAGSIAAGNGGVTSVTGTGGTGGGNSAYGVSVSNAGAQIAASAGGMVTVTGTGGGSVGSRDDIGVKVNNGGSIKAGGLGGVTVHGYGGGGSGDVSYGVYVFQNGAQIASNGGSVAVTGTGGTGSGNNDIGVFVDQAGSIAATGAGTTSVTGTGGTGGANDFGVYVKNAGGSISSGGGAVSVTGTGGSVAGSEAVRVEFGGLISSGSNAAITVTGDSMALLSTSSINAGSGTVSLLTETPGTAIDLGSTTDTAANTLELSDAELGSITAGKLVIGETTAGSITVSAAIAVHAGYSTLDLVTGGAVVEGGGGLLTVATLQVTASTGIGTSAAPLRTQVSTLGADTATGGVFLTNGVTSPTTLNIAGIDGVQVTGASGDVRLINTGSIDVLTDGDTVRGPGNVFVQAVGTTADVVTGGQSGNTSIRGLASGVVTVEAGQDLLLGDNTGFGSVRSVSGSLVLTAGRNITVNGNAAVTVLGGTGTLSATASGDITMQASPANGTNPVFATAGGSIALTTGAGHTFTADSTGTTAVSSSGGNITIGADGVAFSKKINAGSGIVTLTPVTSGRAIALGTNPISGKLGISQGDLNQITAGVLRVGDLSNSGSIAVTAAITAATTGFTTLSLLTNVSSTISQGNGDSIAVAHLLAAGGAGVNLGDAGNAVDSLAGASEGGFTFVDSTNLDLNLVDSGLGFGFGTGIIGGGPVALTANSAGGSLTLDQAIDTTKFGGIGHDVHLNADQMTFNAGVNGGTAGIVSLDTVTKSRAITIGATMAGTLSLDDTDFSHVTASVVRVGSAAQAGAISIAGNVTTHAGYNALALSALGAGGAIVENGGSIAVANLLLQANAGIGSAGAIAVVGPIRVAFHNVSTNNVAISSTGALTIAAVDGSATSDNLASGGTVTLSAASPITIAVSTSSSGTYSMTSMETASEGTTPLGAPDDDITVNTGVTVESSGGDVNLTSGDGITTASGSLLKADTGTVNLKIGVGDNDADATLALNGTISGNVSLTQAGDIFLDTLSTALLNRPGKTIALTSTAGGIFDNTVGSGDTGDEPDVIAGTLALSAVTGIGTSTDPIVTQVGTLAADTGTGGVYLTNSGDLAIGDLNGVFGVLDTGTSGDIVLTNAGTVSLLTSGDSVYSVNGSATVTATGATSNVVVNAGPAPTGIVGGVNVTVQAGQDILVGSATGTDAIDGGGGIATLTAGRDVILDDGAQVGIAFGQAGSAAVTATRNITLRHTTTPGALIATSGGGITLTTGVGGVFTLDSGGGGEVTSTASGGNADIAINADDMVLNDPVNAGTGTVTLRQAGTTTRAITLGLGASGLGLSNAELNQVTAGLLRVGRLDNAGDITVDGPVVTNGGYTTLSLLTGGAIADTNITKPDVVVTNLSLQAAAGISLDTAVSNVAFRNTTSGNVRIDNTGGLTLTTVNTLDGSAGHTIGNFGSGTIGVSASGPLNVSVNVSASGNISLSATDLPTVGQDLNVAAGVTVNSNGGNILLQAGDNLTIDPTAHVTTTSSGTITTNGDYGNVDATGGTTITFSGASLTATAGATVNGGGFADTFDISPSANTPITVNGAAPTTSPGDALNLDLTGTTGPTLGLTGVGSGTFTFANLDHVAYTSIENVNAANNPYDLVLDMAAAGFQDGNASADAVQAKVDATDAVFQLLAGKDGAALTNFFSASRTQINSFTLLGSTDKTSLELLETNGFFPAFAVSAPATYLGNPTGVHSDAGLLPANTLTPANAGINFRGNASASNTFQLTSTASHAVSFFSDGTNSGNVGVSGSTLVSLEGVAGKVLQGAGGTLRLDASLTSTSTLTVADNGTAADGLSRLTGDAGFGTADFGGYATVTVRGGTGGQTIGLNALDTADHTLATVDLSTGAANDTFDVGSAATGLAALNGVAVNIDGGANTAGPTITASVTAGGTTISQTLPVGDVVNVDDQASTTGGTYTLTGTTVQRALTSLITLANTETLYLNLSQGVDTVNVTTTPAGVTSIAAPLAGGKDTFGIATTAAGSLLMIDAAAAGSATTAITGAGSLLFVNGNAGSDSLTLSGSGTGAGVRFDGAGGNDVAYVRSTGAGSATQLLGGAGNDSFLLGSTAHSLASIRGSVSADGGAGINGLGLDDSGDGLGRAYYLTNSRVDRSGAGSVSYANLSSLNVDGTSGNDSFTVVALNPAAATTLNGHGGNDAFTFYANVLSGYNHVFVDGGAGVNTLAVLDDSGGAVMHDHASSPTSGIVTVDYSVTPGARHSEVNYQNITSVVTDPSADGSYVQALFHQIFGRNASRYELNYYAGFLQAQGSLALVSLLEHSPEGAIHTVYRYAMELFGRTATAAEVNLGVSLLLTGSSEEEMLGAVFGSPEYFNGYFFRVAEITSTYTRLFGIAPPQSVLDSLANGNSSILAIRELLETDPVFYNYGK